ncbi:hypothetical protein PsYK624_011160 [Phanerochaete sordida]|uniref:Uncharacterized protein n=1 Tax=Phanerochaete sordida TaxID=48140 RepID=A0A9P3FZL4_9APHY|nr:hypothetical protein PsYK624_011160 [Phanerochaete sordida]
MKRPRLPLELLTQVVSIALAEHVDSLLVGSLAHAPLPFCKTSRQPSRECPDVAESLLLVSYQVHVVSVKMLSNAFQIDMEESTPSARPELQRSPWIAFPMVRRVLAPWAMSDVTRPIQRSLSSVDDLNCPLLRVYCLVHILTSTVNLLKTMNPYVSEALAGFLLAPELAKFKDDPKWPGNSAARDIRGQFPLCPVLFQDVLRDRFEDCLITVGRYQMYDVHFMQLMEMWKATEHHLVHPDEQRTAVSVENNAAFMSYFVAKIQESDLLMRRDWIYTKPLDEALGRDRIDLWCTFLRKIRDTEHNNKHLTSDGTIILRSILQDFEERLARLPSP